MSQCKNCNNFDLSENICLIDGSKGYENQKCLHENCDKFKQGHWTTNEDEHKPFYSDGKIQAFKIVGWNNDKP